MIKFFKKLYIPAQVLYVCISRVIQQQFRGDDQQQWNTFHPSRRVTTEDSVGAGPQQPPVKETAATAVSERESEWERMIKIEIDSMVHYSVRIKKIKIIMGDRFRLIFHYRVFSLSRCHVNDCYVFIYFL